MGYSCFSTCQVIIFCYTVNQETITLIEQLLSKLDDKWTWYTGLEQQVKLLEWLNNQFRNDSSIRVNVW